MLEQIGKYNFWDGDFPDTGYLRQTYLDKLVKSLGNNLIKILIGQRRSGKSYIMLQLIKHLVEKQQVNPVNIFYLNLDMQELDFIVNAKILQEMINLYRKKLQPQGKIYVFLDEVQNIDSWEKTANSLSQNYKTDFELFITGSNSNLLSSELSTLLGGRYLKFEIYPFSYGEYLGYQNLRNNRHNFINYLQQGGIPEIYKLPDEEMKRNYQLNLLDSIVLRDLVNRHQVRDVDLLKKLIHFLIDSAGCLFSVHSVVKTFIGQGYKTNSNTLGNYLKYLEEAWFIHESPRYDLKGKKVLSGERKYYLNDLGFKFHAYPGFAKNWGRYLENLVFLHLKRLGFTVYTGKLRKKEIDFIATKNDKKIYLQVTWQLSSQKIIDREFGNLEEIKDNHEKLVISFDEVALGNKNGIKHQLVHKYLSGGF